MPNIINELMFTEMKGLVDASPSFIVVDPTKLNSEDTLKLRTNLRAAGARLKVAKVSILERIVPESAKGMLNAKSTIGLILAKDMLAAAKVVTDINKDSKETVKVAVKGGVMDGKAVTPADIKVLAELPSIDVLRGMFVNILAAPLTGFVRVIAEIEKKQGGGSAA
jgi:large subunit ribosomal protein L10